MVKSKNYLNKILKNKSLFWFAIILSIIQLCIFIKEKSYKCLLLFVSSSLIIKTFTNNLVLSLFVSLLLSNFIFGCTKITEGLDNNTDVNELKGLLNLVKKGGANTNSLENVTKMASQLQDLKKQGGNDMSLDMGSLNSLLKFNSKISSSNLNNKDDVKKAVQHLRANKELLKRMIDKF
tara:strand:+ start:286 stop:822 length:537 start_codon:yes stop_codon:yes gene_type:complete